MSLLLGKGQNDKCKSSENKKHLLGCPGGPVIEMDIKLWHNVRGQILARDKLHVVPPFFPLLFSITSHLFIIVSSHFRSTLVRIFLGNTLQK